MTRGGVHVTSLRGDRKHEQQLRTDLSMSEAAIDGDSMVVWDGTGHVPAHLRGAVVAIGNFDGVHLGHKALLGQAAALAADRRTRLVVMTFEPHPRSVFKPDSPVFRLTPPDVRRRLLAGQGVTGIAELAFDRTFASQSAGMFIDDLLVTKLKVAGVVVGSDFAFGKGREGNIAMLQRQLAALKVPVLAVEPVCDAEGLAISSSRVRDCLTKGDIAAANALLGHRWCVRAEVVHGDKRGRLLGFPTANMMLRPDNRLHYGIYAVRILIDHTWRAAVASFGRRPTFDDGAPRLETFVFDFAGDLYGQTLEVEFVGWIRGEAKFGDVSELISQMQVDSARARALVQDTRDFPAI